MMKQFLYLLLLGSALNPAWAADGSPALRSPEQVDAEYGCLVHLVDDAGLESVGKLLVMRINSPIATLARRAESIALLMRVQRRRGTWNLYHHHVSCPPSQDWFGHRCNESTGVGETLIELFKNDPTLAERLFAPGGALSDLHFFPATLPESYMIRLGDWAIFDDTGPKLFDDILATGALNNHPGLAAYFMRALAGVGNVWMVRHAWPFSTTHYRLPLPAGFVEALESYRWTGQPATERRLLLDALQAALIYRLPPPGTRRSIWHSPFPLPVALPSGNPLASEFQILQNPLSGSPAFLRWAYKFAGIQSDWASSEFSRDPAAREDWLRVTAQIREAAAHALAALNPSEP